MNPKRKVSSTHTYMKDTDNRSVKYSVWVPSTYETRRMVDRLSQQKETVTSTGVSEGSTRTVPLLWSDQPSVSTRTKQKRKKQQI